MQECIGSTSKKAKESFGQTNVLISEIPATSLSVSNSCQTSTNSYNKNSFFFDLWHKRLGHRSSKFLTKILNECNIHVESNNKIPFFCTSCQLGKSHKLPFVVGDFYN